MNRPIRTTARLALRAAVLGTVLALGTMAATPACAAAPMVRTQAPGYFRMMLGAFEITALNDGTVDLPVDKLLHQPPEATRAEIAGNFQKIPTETSVNGFLVNTGTKLVLVDTGAGKLFGPTLGRLLSSLEASGYKPEQVDDIIITHMHGDHIGGLSADGRAVFPNAVVHAGKADADRWLSEAAMAKAPAADKGSYQGAMAMFKPYEAAGRFKPIAGDGPIVPGIRVIATPGHTPGHTSVVVESEGHRLIVTGDLIHVGAVQFPHPGVTVDFDSDAPEAAASRARVFGMAAKEGDFIAAAHISFPGIGHLQADGTGWRWLPVQWTENR